MKNQFMSSMKSVMDNKLQRTENGALGYATTGKALLDFNFFIGSARNASEMEITKRFKLAFFEHPLYSLKLLYNIGDIREGLGERRVFNVCMDWLCDNQTALAIALLSLIPEYSRWDYLVKLINHESVKKEVVEILNRQFKDDLAAIKSGKSPSLLAKWSPSENATSYKTKELAKTVIKALGLTPKQYRKMLSSLRNALHEGVVETYMSSKNWGGIDYSKVCSNANLKYNNAFLRQDEDRRREYLASLQKGEAKINSAVLFPHDIVHKYCCNGYYSNTKPFDAALEEMWKGLPDYVNGNGKTLVVGDGSGSMYAIIGGNTSVKAVDVANALAIYFAERSSGQFKDKYITFGGNPHLVDFSKCKSLKDKIDLAFENQDCMNTDIEKVFNLILSTAVQNNMPQEDMPDNVLIISDGEFDSACYYGEVNGFRQRYDNKLNNSSHTLFDTISKRFEEHGYKLPKLIFWNVNSRTNTIPLKENSAGVILVSGFSPAVCKMVLSNELDPYKALLEQINTPRYQPVEDAVKSLIA